MRSKLFVLASLMLVFAFLLGACQPAAPAAPASGGAAAPAAKEWKSKDPTVWNEVTFGEPQTLDPSLTYETAGGEILDNVYDKLIFFNKDSGIEFVPMLATEVPSLANGGVSADGLTYTFKIRPGVVFHDGTPMTVEDVAWTFQRNVLAGGTSSPQWMMMEPLFGAGMADIAEVVDVAANGGDIFDKDAVLGYSDATAYDDRVALGAYDPAVLVTVCEAVKSKIVADAAAGTVTFKLAQPWAPFIPTLAGGGWGAVQSKAWVSANGGWNGDCASWTPFYAWTSEEFNATPLGVSGMGTGPYVLDHWTAGDEIVMKANENYWMKDALWEGAPVGAPALKTVILKQVDEFSTRLAMAVAGDADNVQVGSTEDWPILDEYVGATNTYADYMAGKAFVQTDDSKPFQKVSNIEVINTRTDAGFNFKINVTGGNSQVGSGKLDGDGINPEFFSDVHIRKAFAYCFDYDTYMKDVLLGEGKQAYTLFLPGMLGNSDDAPHATYDLKKCEEEFKLSQWKGEDGTPLWDLGFRVAASYNVGNTLRQTIAELLQAGIGKVNPKFVVETVGLPWANLLSLSRAKKLAIRLIGWQSDYFDPHNWASTFTAGYYSFQQNFPAEIRTQFGAICTECVTTTDPVAREKCYLEKFNPAYFELTPAILLATTIGRSYQQRYVNGWFVNPMYSGRWYYALSKN